MAIEIGSLVVEMSANVARLSQDMARATSTVDGAMAKVKAAASAATTALGLIGSGIAVAGLANIVRGSIDAMAALDDMAEKTGATVESLSALADVATFGGHQMSVVEGGMVRLTKALAGGDDEAKAAGHALAALGLKADELRKMDTGAAMLEVAKALDKWEDSGGKTALVMDLLGKNGAAMLPFLKDLAEKGELTAKVTGEQAAEAEKLQKQYGALRVAGEDLSRSLAKALIPTLADVTTRLSQAFSGGLVDGFVSRWKAAFLGLAAGLAETNAGIEEFLAKVTWGSVSENHTRQALQARASAKAIYEELARQAPPDRSAPPTERGTLDYTSAAGGGAGKAAKAAKEAKVYRDGQSAKEVMDELHATDKLAQKYIDLIDPVQRYRVELEEIRRLRESGDLTATQALEAEWRVQEKIDEQMAKGTEKIKEQSSAARDLGMTFSSAFEDAVVGGKKFSDVLKGLSDDIARIIVRKQITEPMAKGVSKLIDGIDFKSLFSFAGGGWTGDGPRAGGLDGQGGFLALMHPRETVTDHAAGGATPSVTVVQHINIDSRSDRATIAAAMIQAKEAAKREIADSMRRGGAFA